MAKTGVLLLVLVLALVTSPSASGEEPRISSVAVESTSQARAALAASIPRRESELAQRRPADVRTEVEQRIQELGVSASADELTDILLRRAHLEIGIDKCRLGSNPADCTGLEAALAAVEASFLGKTGLSTREFRSGRRDPRGPADAPAGEREIRGVNAPAVTDTCTCTFSVYSANRWMNRFWALECSGHGGHGVCSNNVDTSFHSSGSGAMTGDIDLYFGGHHAHRECPDDHETCFQGPSTDHFGEWGNTCSCDPGHSQFHTPWWKWYGGDLTHSPSIHQLSTGWLSVGGACNENWVSVNEFIEENDPWCCDDPMGNLSVTLPLAEGPGVTSGQASAQNCNGGSQGGVYPNCGTFGAQIHVAYICQTYTPPPPPDCDPQAEQACWDMGWNWDPWTCNCTDPCRPDGYCSEYDYVNCVCLRV